MTHRYTPNEATCPVPLDLLALMLRSDKARVILTVDTLPARQRASLAAFCFYRCHMRSLAFVVASRCDERSLRDAGLSGTMLLDRAQSGTNFDQGPTTYQKRQVTLARLSA